MRFRTRAFLICFIPFAILLSASFWMIQRFVQRAVRDGVRTSLRESQTAISRVHAKSNLQNSRFLKVAGENSALKAGMQLLVSHPGSEAARRTVEDQLLELGEHMGFDFLLVLGPNGAPIAGVVRPAATGAATVSALVPLEIASLERGRGDLLINRGRTFQVASIPVDQNEENLGSLAVGEFFDFSEFTTAAVLIRNGRVIASNISDIPSGELEAMLQGCAEQPECDFRLRGANWISLPMQSFGGGYVLRSLENVDKAMAPVQSRLRNLFISVALISVLVALLCSLAASRSIVEPIAAVVSHLRNAVRTGVLPEFEGKPSSTLEIRELADSYNRAAVAVRGAGEKLESAYTEFVGSLANALDARDRYTSGHSWRVSELSCAIARAMHLSSEHIERIRIGALLHDIGKIGMADRLLQKPGDLTDEEFAIVKDHPLIGRRILEGVEGFSPYLDAVALHHENWDGTGYPMGKSADEIPMDARIIHVADAYDAMTSDRSYRRGMTRERALLILQKHAGTQYDPEIVEVFASLPREVLSWLPVRLDASGEVGSLAPVEAG